MNVDASTRAFDLIVLGCGAMGAAALFHCARRGMRVLGIEQFRRGHAFGSSHGHSRIIRQAYFEHPDYVPLVRRSYELFRELEHEWHEHLLVQSGAIFAGHTDSEVVRGSVHSALTHGIAHDVLDGPRLRAMFPQFDLPRGHVAVWEPTAGFVRPEATTLAHLRLGEACGASVLEETRVESWRRRGDSVEVRTSRGVFTASQIVVAAGAWSGSLLPAHTRHLRVTRQPIVWIDADPAEREAHAAPTLPVWLVDRTDGVAVYGIPSHQTLDGPPGMKVALHGGGAEVAIDAIDRRVTDREIEAVVDAVRSVLPRSVGRVTASAVCAYTYSPDTHFIVHRIEAELAIVACGFSGHGFKFAPLIGEAIADLAIDGRTRHAIEFLSGSRYGL